ncbi:MAG: EVE domain-containing protein [Flavobacteriales bacterium]|nr:EVE domain-containing protein [Flavobacteriales bacterium]MCB9449126.1 EVE domain-containing protein [Flavobacteriales bacterium]
MNHWLVKSEPTTYAWEQLLKDKKTSWDGVRNYAARLHLMDMKKGDLVLYYHSNQDRSIVGVAEVTKTHYQDPTTDDDRWVAVDIKPVQSFNKPVTLSEVKAEPKLQQIALVRIGRLSVMPLKKTEFDCLLKMGQTKL